MLSASAWAARHASQPELHEKQLSLSSQLLCLTVRRPIMLQPPQARYQQHIFALRCAWLSSCRQASIAISVRWQRACAQAGCSSEPATSLTSPAGRLTCTQHASLYCDLPDAGLSYAPGGSISSGICMLTAMWRGGACATSAIRVLQAA